MKFIIITTGVITCLPIIYALFPKWALSKLNKITYNASNGLIVKHWGILCLMMGLSIIYASYNPKFLPIVLSMAIFEKLFLVLFILTGFLSHKNEFYKSFISTLIFDLICSGFYIYILFFY